MMTSGLDSIALAVAHLEEIGNTPTPNTEASPAETAHLSQEGNASVSAVTTAAPSALPATMTSRPTSFLSAPTSRVVSSESISSATGLVRTAPTVVAENDVVPAIKMFPQQQQQQQPKPTAPVTVSAASQDVNNNPSSSGTGTSNNNLALILADPNSWLQATEHISKLPEAPAGTFEKILQEDVLCGRGGESNHHPGNQQYRRLVKAFQPLYIASKRRDKPRIAQCIVYTIRSYGGRFLKRTTGASPEGASSNTQLFEDVGNTKAREKTSQALREGAPELRGVSPGNPAGNKETADQMLNNSSAQNSKQSSPLTLPPVQQTQVPSGIPARGFLNAQLLQQLPYGAHPGAFHHHHPYFAAPQHLTPLQQALLAAAAPPSAQAVVPAVAKHGFVDQQAPLPIPPVQNENPNKRPPPHVVSSEDNHSTGSSEGSTSASVRGPRLKRLKHRLQQESTEEGTTTPINTTA